MISIYLSGASTVLGKYMDISSSTELLYVSKVGSLFTNQRASKFGRESEVNFHLHLKIS